jgi:hypothetical protein
LTVFKLATRRGLWEFGITEERAFAILRGDGDLCTIELIERPLNADLGIVPEHTAIAGRIIAASRFVEHLSGFGENEESVGEALWDPEEFELTLGIPRLKIEAGPAPEVGRVAAKIYGDVPDVPGEDPNEFALRVAKLVVKAPKDTADRKRLIVLCEGVRKIERRKGVCVEDFGKPAPGVAMAFWLQDFYIAQRGIT